MVKMRDGVHLSTIVIFPPKMKRELGEKRGTMMARSPYAPTSDQIADVFTAMNGFVAVVQDRELFLSKKSLFGSAWPSLCVFLLATKIHHIGSVKAAG
jgi:hypothetical protein